MQIQIEDFKPVLSDLDRVCVRRMLFYLQKAIRSKFGSGHINRMPELASEVLREVQSRKGIHSFSVSELTEDLRLLVNVQVMRPIEYITIEFKVTFPGNEF